MTFELIINLANLKLFDTSKVLEVVFGMKAEKGKDFYDGNLLKSCSTILMAIAIILIFLLVIFILLRAMRKNGRA